MIRNALIVLILSTCFAFGKPSVFSLSEFSGLVDIIITDKMNQKYSPDCLNVLTDEDGILKKRRGSVPYNEIALPGNQPIKSSIEYTLNNGLSYIIINSSTSVWANLTGSTFTAIATGLTANAIDSYCIAKNLLYRDNGVDGLGGKWDGVTYTSFSVVNTTSMVSGKYIIYWHNRLIKCGVTSDPSVVFYSGFNADGTINLEDFGLTGENYVNINKNDGDIITGAMVAGDQAIITKKYSTYQLYETDSGDLLAKRIADKVGCLYNSTMDILDGYPVWFSHRGVEQLVGNTFETLSLPIDNTIKGLPAASANTQYLVDNTGDKFGAGTFIALSTSVNNCLSISSGGISNQYVRNSGNTSDWTNDSWQTFTPSITAILSNVIINVKNNAVSPDYTLCLRGGDLTSGVTITQVLSGAVATTGDLHYQFNVMLTSGQVYELACMNNNNNSKWYRNTDVYARGGWYVAGVLQPGRDATFETFMISTETLQYTSGQKNATTTNVTWQRWATLSYSGNDLDKIAIYLKSAAPASNLAGQAWTKYANNSPITLSSGAWIQYYAEFTSTKAYLTDVSIEYAGIGNIFPQGKVYNKRYYLAVSTDSTLNRNNIELVYQKDKSWTKFNNRSVGAYCIYGDKLYYGSGATANVYRDDVDGIYTDNSLPYTSYWVSPVLDFGAKFNEKIYRTMRVGAVNSGNWNMYVNYRLDGRESDYTTKNVPLSGSGTILYKIPFTHATKGYSIQFKVGNNNSAEYFGLKNIDVEWDIQNAR